MLQACGPGVTPFDPRRQGGHLGVDCLQHRQAVDAIECVREVDGGLETLELTMPALITTDLRLNHPRYTSLPGIMKAKKKEIKEIPADSMGIDLAPKVRELKYTEPATRSAGVIVENVDALLDKLRNEAKVL